MVSRRKERVSTGLTGVGLLGVGATLRHKGVEQADRLAQAAGNKPPKLGPFVVRGAQVVRDTPGSGRAKLLYGAGSALGLAGGAALGSAATNSGPKRRRQVVEPASVIKLDDSAKTFLGSGLQGTKDAMHSKGKNLTEKKPVGAIGINLGVGTGAAAAGAHGTHALFHRLDAKRALKGIKPSILRHPATAVAGTALAIGSIPLSNKIVQHHYPEYKVTPFGVKRAKKAPVRPSSKANVLEGRANHGGDARAFRSQLVGKLLSQPKAPGMDREQTIRQVKAKRRKLRTDATNTVLGTAGVGLLAAKHVPTIAIKFPNLEHHALSTAIAGGGVGAVGGIQGYRITHRDLKAQEKSLKISKYERHMQLPYRLNPEPEMLPMRVVAKAAWGMPPVPKPLVLKPSYIRQQRTTLGIKPVRVAQTFGKLDNNQRNSAMTASGSVLAGTGLVAGGLPGVREPNGNNVWLLRGATRKKKGKIDRKEDLKPKDPRGMKSPVHPSNLGHNVKHLGPLPKAGILGYRSNVHQSFIDENHSKTKGNAYVRGNRAGKLIAEDKVVHGMRLARRGSYGLTLGGGALAATGMYRSKNNVGKRNDNFQRNATSAVAGGTTLAAVSNAAPKVLDKFSRNYSNSAKKHVLAAHVLHPGMGGLETLPEKRSEVFGNVTRKAKQTMYPAKTDKELREAGEVGRIRSASVAEQVGRHRGIAAQERHFVEAMDGTSKVIRRLRAPAVAVAAMGAAGLAGHREIKKPDVTKRDTPAPLKTTVSEDDARRLVERHGLKGPLPKTLNREQKMAAYEARYVSAGGHQANKWQHRSNQAEKARVASVGAASLAGGAWLASRGKNKVSLKLSSKFPRLQHHAENAAVGAATAGGGAELYGAHARRKRSSYASSPSGVAASALRRMQGYTPD